MNWEERGQGGDKGRMLLKINKREEGREQEIKVHAALQESGAHTHTHTRLTSKTRT